MPAIKELMNALYNCKYRDFFVALVAVVDQLLLDRYLAPHATFFLRQVGAFRSELSLACASLDFRFSLLAFAP
jgi:hypothetical protein